jgi:hypothetical protein
MEALYQPTIAKPSVGAVAEASEGSKPHLTINNNISSGSSNNKTRPMRQLQPTRWTSV